MARKTFFRELIQSFLIVTEGKETEPRIISIKWGR
jgi:hypothetical protein